MSDLRMDHLFNPSSIAVVGATETSGAVGCEVIENLLHHGYCGKIFPINPKYRELHGMVCYDAITELPEIPDVLVVAVPAKIVPAIVRTAGEFGIPFAVVFASGFAEAGAVGSALQEQLQSAAQDTNIRVIGPNCQGFMNIADNIHIGFGPPYRLDYRKGNVSVVSQSGAFGNSLLMGLNGEGLGLRHYASTGNEVNTSLLDLIGGLLDDSETAVVGGYVEGLSDAAGLRRVAVRALERECPLVLWKVGISTVGMAAAALHTANLAGDPACYQAAFDQLGILRANDVGDMADLIHGLKAKRWGFGPRVGVVTISGGAGIAMADRAEELGLRIEPFEGSTLTALRDNLPKFASFANPLDVTAGALGSPEVIQAALQKVVEDTNVDMLAVGLAAASGTAARVAARSLADIAAQHNLPIVVAWNAPHSLNAEAYAILEEANIPVYATPRRAIRGLSAAYSFGTALQNKTAVSRLVLENMTKTATQVELLDEVASKAFLTGTGINAPPEEISKTASEAVSAAASFGTPVVMKLLSAAVAHKSDIGGVRLNLAEEDSIHRAFDDISTVAATFDPPGQVLVQKQVSGGTEAILGVRIDDVFGPMVMFGAGGIFAELFSDVSFRLAPIDEDEAMAMINEPRFAKMLKGARGREPADVSALCKAIVGLSELIAREGTECAELEINPLFILKEGQGVTAGDCVAYVRSEKKAHNNSCLRMRKQETTIVE